MERKSSVNTKKIAKGVRYFKRKGRFLQHVH